MLIDARSLSNDESLCVDVCIVGGGTAGLTLAYSLIGKGISVALLESGGLKPDKQSHALNWGENIGLPYYDLDVARARFFGGCCNRWHVALGNRQLGARIRPLDGIDFEERDWVPYSGWPFGKSQLETYYDRAQALCRTTPVSYDIHTWSREKAFEVLPLAADVVESIVFKFCSKDPFIQDYVDAVKQAAEIKAFYFANVTAIDLDDNARNVGGLTVGCQGPKQFRVTAKSYVLAAGGIEIPRILLASTHHMACGIGNQNDLVGRFFMEHLHFWSGLFIPSDSRLVERMALYNAIQQINGLPIIAKLALSESTKRRERLINHNIQLIPQIVPRAQLYSYFMPSRPTGAVATFRSLALDIRQGKTPSGEQLKKSVSGLGRIAKEALRRGYAGLGNAVDKRHVAVYRLANMTEQVPNPDCRITLGADRDPFGIPRVRLNWQVTPQDLDSAIRVQEIVRRELARAGLGRLFIDLKAGKTPANLHGGYHHMGTTRMHDDPQKGVVDANSRVHGLSNLFVAGPSVFPTGGHANPILTLVALTLRLSDHLTQVLQSR